MHQIGKSYEDFRDFYLNFPNCKDINLQFVSGSAGTSQIACVDWREDLADSKEKGGGLHSGVITTLMDTLGAIAVAARMQDFDKLLVTLDLRVDFLNPPKPHKPVFAKAYCYDSEKEVFFVRVRCYQDDQEEHPLALGTSTYMMISRERKK